MDYKKAILNATEEYRVETKTVSQLQGLVNQMKAMESMCRYRCEYQMESFYRNAKIGYQKRLDKLIEQQK